MRMRKIARWRMGDRITTDTGPFAIVPVALLEEAAVDDRALRAWCGLASWADVTGEAHPEQADVAVRIGVSVKTLQRGIGTLIDAGWVSVSPRKFKGRKVGNDYHLLRGYKPDQSDTSDASDTDNGSDTSDRAEATPEAQPETTTGVALFPTDQGTDQVQTKRILPPVDSVFVAWKESTGRNGNTRLTPERRKRIVAALKDYPLDDVLDAVRGWRHSPFHAGQNDQQTVYNDLNHCLRDGGRIEQFRDFTRGAGPQAEDPMLASIRRIREREGRA